MAQDSKQLRPDICVIGGGAGGLAAAAAAATVGATVVLVEKGKMGGVNLNSGTLPSKALMAAAAHAKALRDGARLGVKATRAGVDFSAVKAHMRQAVAAAEPQDSRERFIGLGVRLVAGVGRFTRADTVAVDDTTIKARRFIVATGSSPVIPAIPGLAESPYLTDETIFDLTDCPRHLIVIGAGRVGLELAQTFRRLGADVTVLDTAAPLAGEDGECAAVVLDALSREGIGLRVGVNIAQVRRTLARIEVVIAGSAGPTESDAAQSGAETSIAGSHLLVAAGRRPNIEELNLDAAGIRYAPHGIVVDQHLRTTNKRVYAIGDVTPAPKFAHVATHHAAVVIQHALLRVPAKVNDRAMPLVTYTDPELAQVGFLEDEARAHAGIIRVLRSPYRDNDRALTTGATNGHIKVVTDRKGDILGATIVGAQASETVAAWALAIEQKLNIRAFAGLVVPYPSYAEVGKRAAITYFMRGLTRARARRIIGWLRRSG